MFKIGIGYLLLLLQLIIDGSAQSTTCTSNNPVFTSYIENTFTVTTDADVNIGIVVTMDASGTGVFTETSSERLTDGISYSKMYAGYFDKTGVYNVAITCGEMAGSVSITVIAPTLYIQEVPDTVIKNQAFTMIIQVQDSNGNFDSGDYSDFVIKVSGTNINTVTGANSGSLYTFSNLAISVASNSFGIPYELKDAKDVVLVTNVKNIKVISADKFVVTAVPTTYYTFFTSTFSVSLTDSTEAVLYSTSTTITLTEGTSNLQGGGSKTDSIGTFSYTVHFTVSDQKFLTFTHGSVVKTVEVTVLKSVLEISVYPAPKVSTDVFFVDVYIYKSLGGNSVDYASSSANSISLELVETTTGNSGKTLSGVKTLNANSGGIAAFTSLSILSSGTFKVRATSTEITLAESTAYPISNLIIGMSLTFNPTTLYTFKTITATIELTGSDGALFLGGECSVTLSESNNYLKNLNAQTNSDGTVDFPGLYFSNYGSLTITATSTGPAFTKDFTVEVKGSVIDITFDDDPSDSLTAFTLTATAKDVSGGTTLTSNGEFTISLALTKSGSGQSGDKWTYTSGTQTEVGEAIFSDLYIKSSGKFYIVASSSGFVNSQSTEFTIVNHVSSITATSLATSSDLYTSVTISYNLIGDDGFNFILSTTVSILPSSSTGLTLTTSTVTPSGTVTLSSSTVADITLEIITTSSVVKSTSLPMKFLIPNIVLTLDPSPTLSITPFTIKVEIKNNANNAVLTGAGGFSVVFSMPCTASYTCSSSTSDAVLSPTITTISIASGQGSVSSVKILSSGRFTAKASYSAWTEVPALTGDVTNLIKKMEFSVPTVYTYFDFTVSITLTGEDDYGFILSCEVTLSDTSTGGLKGTLKYTEAAVTRSFPSLYYTVSGSFTLTATFSAYSASGNTGVTVTPSVIVVELSDTPSLSTTSFTLTATVKKTSTGTTESTHGPHEITLELVPQNGVVNSGTVIKNYAAKNTALGIAEFSGLYVLSSGDFIIKAKSTSALTSGSSDPFGTKNFIKSISLTYTGTQELYTSFTVTVSITGDDSLPFISSATTTLKIPSEVTVTSANPKTSTTGSHSFDMYCTLKGTSTVPVSVTDDTITETDDIYLVLNTPTLKFSVSASPSSSNNLFNLIVGVYDSNGASILPMASGLTIDFTMDCNSEVTCSDNVYNPSETNSITTDGTSTGQATGLKILSSGIFEFSSTYKSWGVTKYTTSSITNYVKAISIAVTPSANYYTYFDISVKVDLTGDDDATFILSVTISISDVSGGTLNGDLSEMVSTGTYTFENLYYEADGDYDWNIYTLSPDVNVGHSITVIKSVIIMEITGSITSSNAFDVSISIKDTLEGTLESTYSHSIVLSLKGQKDGTIPLSGEIWTYSEPKDTSSGTIKFEDLRILSSGDFIISASSSGLEDAESITYNVENFVKTTKITTTYTGITTYMDFDITVCLLGEDDNDYLLDAEITLTHDSDLGSIESQSASSSCATFTFYTSTFKNIAFSASTTKDYEDVTLQGLTVPINKPKLKITLKSAEGEEVSPTSSSDIFDILVELYDLSFTNVLTYADDIVIDLKIECTADESVTCSGTGLNLPLGEFTLSSGSVLLENIQILSSGVFIFTASGTDFVSYLYETKFIENSVDSIIIDLPEVSFYTYFNYDIGITLLGQDGELFLLPTTVTIVNNAGGILKEISNTGLKQTVTIFFTFDTDSDYLEVSTSPYVYSSPTDSFQVSPLIIVLDITSLPTSSIVPLVADVSVYDEIGENFASDNNVLIELELKCATTCSGEIMNGYSPKSTVSGQVTFSDIYIISCGSFIISASGTGLITSESDPFDVINYVKTIEILPSFSDISAHQYFYFTVNLYGQDGSLYICEATIALISDRDDIVFEDQTTTDGSAYYYNVLIPLSGLITFSATTNADLESDEFSNPELSLDILKDRLVISPGDYIGEEPKLRRLSDEFYFFDPESSYESFSLIVAVYDNFLDELLYTTLGIEFTFEISCTEGEKCSGLVLEIENDPWTRAIGYDGYYEYVNTKFLSSGYFTLKVVSEDMIDGYYYSDFITNYVKSYAIEVSSKTPSINFDLETSVTLYGDDDNVYILPVIAKIGTTEATMFTDNIEDSTQDGEVSFITWFPNPGSATIVLTTNTSEYYDTVDIVVLKNLIKIFGPNPDPVSNLNKFDISVEVRNNEGTEIESKRGQYGISFTSDPKGTLMNYFLTTKSGIETLSTLMYSSGTYTLTASGTDLISSSLSILIEKNFTYATYSESQLTQEIYSFFEFKLQLMETETDVFSDTAFLEMTCPNAYIYDPIISTQNGTASFYLYFKDLGSKVCTITSDYSVVTFNVVFEINPSENIDELCVVSLSSNVCYLCVDNAYPDKDGVCKCISDSEYSENLGYCECILGFALYNGYCIQCGNYYSSSDIFGFYSEDYKSIIVVLNYPALESFEMDCSYLVSFPFPYEDRNFGCYWQDSVTMVIEMELPIFVDISLEIDPKNLHRYDGKCSYEIADINIEIYADHSLPAPITSIDSLDIISLGCFPDQGFIISSEFTSDDYDYSWSAIVTPSIPELEKFISDTKDSKIKIPENLLSESYIDITLVITSISFSTKSSYTKNIEVTNKLYIPIVISSNNNINIVSDKKYIIKTKLMSKCFDFNDMSLTWYITYDEGTPEPKFNEVDITSPRPDFFVINPGLLTPGYTYTFVVEANSSSILGSDSVDLYVEHASLYLDIDTVNGVIGNDINFEISAFAYDPDDYSAEIKYTWKCYEGIDSCLDKNQKTLSLEVSGSKLTVDSNNLRDKALYTFKVTVEANEKSAELSVDIEIDYNVKGSIKISSSSTYINNYEEIYITPGIFIDNTAEFLWSFQPSLSPDVDIVLNTPFLTIPPLSLDPSIRYKLTLEMKTSISTTYSYMWINQNLPPTCDRVYAEFLGDDKWEITASNCQDDNESLITYQYFIGISDTEFYWVSVPLLTSSVIIYAPETTSYFGVVVCDSDYSCMKYPSDATSSERRTSDLITSYEVSTADPDSIPSSIVYFGSQITTSEDFAVIFDSFVNYYSTEPIDKHMVKTLISNLYVLIQYDEFLNDDYLKAIVNLRMYIIQNYDYDIDYEEALILLEIIKRQKNNIEGDKLLMFLENIGKNCMGQSLLDTTVYFEDSLTVFRTRKSGYDLLNSTISLQYSEITIPSDLDIDEDSVYDIAFSRYNSSSNSFELSIYYVGTYISYTLIIEEPVLANLTMDSGLEVKIYGDFNSDTDYKCEVLLDDWNDDEGCEVLKSTGDYAIVKLTHLSTFRIVEDDNLCETGRGPIATMSVILFMMITLCLIFYLVDRTRKHFKTWNSFLVIYPITSMFLPQKSPRRSAVAMQFLTSELLLLTLVGAFMHHFDSPNDHTSYVFDKYYGFQLSRGAAAWALCQIYTIPAVILNFLPLKNLENKWAYILTFIYSLIITCGCFAGIIIMTVKYCGGWTELWIINFLIFTLFDWATLEIIYAICLWLFYRNNKPSSYYESPQSGKDHDKLAQDTHPNEHDTKREKKKHKGSDSDEERHEPDIIAE